MIVIFIGWFGTLLYLVNHSYISLAKNWKNSIYYGGNALAASCLVMSSYVSHSWQAVVINSFWALISIALLSGINLNSLKLDKRLFHLVVIVMLLFFVAEFALKNQWNLALLGWVSAFSFSACYLLFSAGKMQQRYYLCWNAFAAVTLLPQLWLDQNWPVFALEICWAIISIYGAIRKFDEVHLVQ